MVSCLALWRLGTRTRARMQRLEVAPEDSAPNLEHRKTRKSGLEYREYSRAFRAGQWHQLDISNNAGSCQEVFCIFCSLFSFFGHTTPFTPKSGLSGSVKLCFDDHGSFVIFRSVSVRPIHLFDPYFDHDYFFKLPLTRERDAPSSARCFTSHHVRFRAVPRTNRTLTMANTHNHSATSSTTELPTVFPSRPWQCFCVDASPGACTDAASRDESAPLLAPPPPTRSATRNCLAC
jgi:hypothetical protein